MFSWLKTRGGNIIKVSSIDAIRHVTTGANYNARIVVVYGGIDDDTVFSVIDVLKALEPLDEAFDTLRAKNDEFYAFLIDLIKVSLLEYFDKILRQDTVEYGTLLSRSRSAAADKRISQASAHVVLSRDLIAFVCKHIAPVVKKEISNYI